MKKTYLKSEARYYVYCKPVFKRYFFEWKPTKTDLKILAKIVSEEFSDDGYSLTVNPEKDFELLTFKFEDASKYNRKLRYA